MTSLQLGLIVAGIALVIGVIIYNWWQERRVRARLDATFSNLGKAKSDAPRAAAADRVEPTLSRREAGDEPMLTRAGSSGTVAGSRVPIDEIDDAQGFELPVKVQGRMAAHESAVAEPEPLPTEAAPEQVVAPTIGTAATQRVVHEDAHGPQPDPDIECIV